ncbi:MULTISPECIES: glycerol-3-phosphate responsive antiterminator [Staphylococcus]|uniref:glycerol-3-phosphate responsive antiterminator n=1 Tax=Staphylococcus TaxID=1279 RepID=UPI002E175DDD|nr:glycerol-3-phosphate responsive antiterminator [Staphylococcus shinii]
MKEDKVVIASVTKENQLEKVLKYKDNLKAVFILTGNFINIKEYVKLYQSNGIDVYIHVEKIKGLKLDDFGFKYIKQSIQPEGIITTKMSHVKLAKKNDIFVIQRFFLADHDMKENIINTAKVSQPDMLEMMPTITSFLIESIQSEVKIPIIMGGLVDSETYLTQALEDGALGVSTANKEMWKREFTDFLHEHQ